MNLSIITPHYNDFEGLQKIYSCLKIQSKSVWEWVIVDDCSDEIMFNYIDSWIKNTADDRIQFVRNKNKSNASVCRNIGAEIAMFGNLVFLDADDRISHDFVLSREIVFNEFVVFKNTAVDDGNGIQELRPKTDQNFMNRFLKANFIWPITATLWKKEFFINIGKFDVNLQRLQDVELMVRALFVGERYKIIENDIDFYYCVKPIQSKVDIVKKSCHSVNYFITKLHSNRKLDAYQQTLIKSYYYACAKGLHRCKKRQDVVFVKESLKIFYKLKYINLYKYFVGYNLLILYQYQLISDSLFIKINRHFFK